MELALAGARLERAVAREPELSRSADLEEQKATLNLLGMTLLEVKLAAKESRKLSSRRGVAVLVVERDLEGFRGGVRNGDIIAEVNSTKIRTLQDLKKVLRNHEPRDPLLVFLLSGEGWRFTNLSFIRGIP